MEKEKNVASVQNLENEKGATMLEYGLIAALIAIVAIAAITFIGQQASITFSRVGSSMDANNG